LKSSFEVSLVAGPLGCTQLTNTQEESPMKTNEGTKQETEDKRNDTETEDLFDEMSVVELEDRLELLAGRCVCRNA
jgi:hypothetical protein